ncbi:MAG: acyl-CoA dehydrogenase family protein [Microbacteriaceae bacterium]
MTQESLGNSNTPLYAERKYQLSDALDTDFYDVFATIPDADRQAWQRARAYVNELLPEVNEAWDKAEYPLHFGSRLGDYDLLTDGVEVAGHEKLSPLAAGLVNMEISRGDGSLGTILAVQAGLCVRTIALFASEEQKAQWLEPVVSGKLPAAFALTEPGHGSDSTSLETSAIADGDEYVINGQKKWIGNGSVGGLTIVWARTEDGEVRAFFVEQDTPGYTGEHILGKISLRGIQQALITFDNVRVPKENMLPGARGFKDTAKVLFASRLGVAWSALGHATAIYEACVHYAKQRIQFGKPIGAFQMVQERLAIMLTELTGMQLYCVHLAELEARGELKPLQASMAKYNNTKKARQIAQLGRDMLGGNGILLENHVARHFVDIESIHTYEGTESVQALLLGREITGIGAFV